MFIFYVLGFAGLLLRTRTTEENSINFFTKPLQDIKKKQVVVLGLGRSGADLIVSFLRANVDDDTTSIIVSSVDALDQIYSAHSGIKSTTGTDVNIVSVEGTIVPLSSSSEVIFDSSPITDLVKLYPYAKFVSISRSNVDDWYDDYSSYIVDVESTLQSVMNATIPLHASLSWSGIYGSDIPSDNEWKSGYQQYYAAIQKRVPRSKLLTLTYEDLVEITTGNSNKNQFASLCSHLSLPATRCEGVNIPSLEPVDLTVLEETIKKATYHQLQSRLRRPFRSTKNPNFEQLSSFAFVTAIPNVADEEDLKAAMRWCQSVRYAYRLMTSKASDFDLVLLVGEGTNAYESRASNCFDRIIAIDPADIPPFSSDITESLMYVTLGMTFYYRVVYMDYTEFVPLNRRLDLLFIREHYVPLYGRSLEMNAAVMLQNTPQLIYVSTNSKPDDTNLKVSVSPSSMEPRFQLWVDMIYLAQTSSRRQVAVWGASPVVDSSMINTTLSTAVNNSLPVAVAAAAVPVASMDSIINPTVVEEEKNYPMNKKRFGSLSAASGLLSQYFFMTLTEDSKRVGVVRYDNLLQNDLLGHAEVSFILLIRRRFKSLRLHCM